MESSTLEQSYNSFKSKLPTELQNFSFIRNAPCLIPEIIRKIDEFILNERKKRDDVQITSEQNIDLPLGLIIKNSVLNLLMPQFLKKAQVIIDWSNLFQHYVCG